MSDQISAMKKKTAELKGELGREPTREEIARGMGISEEDVDDLTVLEEKNVSLSDRLSDDGLEVEDRISDEISPPVEYQIIKSSVQQQIRTMIGELDEKEALVLRLRFGLDDDRPRTLQEIGNELGLTRERIRQIEQKAMRKLSRSRRPPAASRIPELSEKTACSRCQGTGWIIETGDKGPTAKRCGCFHERQAAVLLEKANIPKRYKDCTARATSRSTRTTTPTRTPWPSRKSSSRTFPAQEIGLLFIGPCGVGKTHLAIGIIQELIEKKNVPCVFYDFRDLIREIQNTFSPESALTESDVLAPVFRSEVLVLDELGAKRTTAWVEETVFYIINHRYNHKKTTIFTSNYPDTEDAEDARDSFYKKGGRYARRPHRDPPALPRLRDVQDRRDGGRRLPEARQAGLLPVLTASAPVHVPCLDVAAGFGRRLFACL